MDALCIVRELDLPQWCIGAGAIRNAVWDHLHGYSMPTPTRDVDVAYFNPANLNVQRDYEIQQQLVAASPKLPWEVTNQAGVHLWFEREFGQPLEPLLSVDDNSKKTVDTTRKRILDWFCHKTLDSFNSVRCRLVLQETSS